MAFFGINVATQGLYTARVALDVTNHNITNAETKGYSRQEAVQRASRPLPAYSSQGMIGTGSEVIGIEQFRNQYFDVKFWSTNRYFGEYDVKHTHMQQIETIFNEPSDTGFSVEFNRLFEQLQKLSTDPSSDAYRATFRDSAISFTKYFNSLDEQLRNLQRDLNFGVKTKVDEINFIAEQLTSVNAQIANIELSGVKANDLRDQRANLIDQLSKIVNVKTNEISEGNNKNRFTVVINGQVLVDGNTANTLELRPRENLYNPEDEPDIYDIYWKTGQKFYIDDQNLGGELKGYLDMRDGNNGENFKAAVVGNTATSVTVQNMNRYDIPTSGELTINNKLVKYTSYSYDTATGQMTFQIDPSTPAPADATGVSIGNTMPYKGVPYYMQKLNEFVRTFAAAMNEIHSKGENRDGQTGQLLFSYKGYTGTPELDGSDPTSYHKITANNFMLDQAVLEDVRKIATNYNVATGVENNELILDLLNLRHDITMFNQGKPESFMQALISELGIDAKQATNFKDGQKNMLMAVENQRLSFSGVDLNEETTNMLKFQHAYNLAAKMISVMDQIYDVTINRMGV